MLREQVFKELSKTRRNSRLVSPVLVILVSSSAIQLSFIFGKMLIVSFGITGTAFICRSFAALFLWVLSHRYRPPYPIPLYGYALALIAGACMAISTISFYAAISRIPLGVAAALEFVGPLSVSLLGSRRAIDLVWVLLAALGIALLHQVSHTRLDSVGIWLALASAACWAVFIITSAQVSRFFPKLGGLAWSMVFASLLLTPAGFSHISGLTFNWDTMVLTLVTAMLGTIIPYSLEFTVLANVPARVFGLLICVEPVIASTIGFLFLGEHLTIKSMAGIGFIMLSLLGANTAES